MSMQNYISEMREIYNFLHQYLENETENNDCYLSLIQLFDKQKFFQNPKKLLEFLHILSQISQNYHQYSVFFDKINAILIELKEIIKQTFTDSQLYKYFNNNKILLYLLLKNEILTLDIKMITDLLKSKEKSLCIYFYPEIRRSLKTKQSESLESIISQSCKYYSINLKDDNIFTDIENKRAKYGNESYICQLIRNESIDDFIVYVNQRSIPLSSQIEPSIFEINPFLIDKTLSFIEYAAFYGSVEIFKYLKLNDVQLTPSLWLYAVHSNKPEIIYILEENKVQIEDELINECFQEAVKCHHNDIAIYIYDNLMKENKDQNAEDQKIGNLGFKYFNFAFIPNNLSDQIIFFYSCNYNHLYLFLILLENKEIDINKKFILDYIKFIKFTLILSIEFNINFNNEIINSFLFE